MEWIVAFLVLWGISALISSNSDDTSSNSNPHQQKPPKNQTQNLYLKISKDTVKKEGYTFYNVEAEGRLPNNYAMNLVGALYLYDDETALPFLSNFNATNESRNSRVFRRNIDFGFQEAGLFYPKFSNIANYAFEGIQPPHKGSRSVRITAYFFDAANPVIFNNGGIIQGKENLLHISEIRKTLTYTEPGYRDEINNAYNCKPLMVEIALQMAMSDGSFDESEGNVIKNWIKQEIKFTIDSKKDDLKKQLNKALESSYKKILANGVTDSAMRKFKKIASKSIKYKLIELCLEVLSADGVATEEELETLETITKQMGLNYDEVQKLKDKTLVKIVTKPSSTTKSATDESIVGLKKNLSNEDAIKFIKKEYRKWNGRLNTLKPGNERDNAQRLLDTLARLRTKYEK